jgi:hypothetical protein
MQLRNRDAESTSSAIYSEPEIQQKVESFYSLLRNERFVACRPVARQRPWNKQLYIYWTFKDRNYMYLYRYR